MRKYYRIKRHNLVEGILFLEKWHCICKISL